MDRETATAIFAGGLGKAEAELVRAIVSPIYWYWPIAGGIEVRNGSIFFLQGEPTCFGVTAAHVVDGIRRDIEQRVATRVQVGQSMSLDVTDRVIDIDREIDIATLRLSADEVSRLGKRPYNGFQKDWPPGPPTTGKGTILAGFPGRERSLRSPNEIKMGMATFGAVATSVSDRDICWQIEREQLIDISGQGVMPENYDMGGMSGGPLLTIVEQGGLRLHRLGGIIYSGPNIGGIDRIEGFDLVRARRAHFLLPNGRIDRSKWV